MDLREALRIKETPKIGMQARQLAEGVAAAEANYQAAKDRKAPEDELGGLNLEVDIARRESELYFWEHDTTGALKGSRFGQDLNELLGSFGVVRDKAGKITCQDKVALNGTFLFQVNMSELDRLNDVGEHEMGDEALGLTLERVQSVARKILVERKPELAEDPAKLERSFDVYRTSGNDFIMIVKGVDAETAEDMARQASGRLDLSGISPKKDEVPLSASHISLADGLALLNRTENADNGDDRTALISLAMEKLQTLNDFEKVRTRGNRMAHTIRSSMSEGQDEPVDLYERYMAKAIGALFNEKDRNTPLNYQDFKARLSELGAFEEHPHAWNAVLFDAASNQAINLLRSRNSVAHGNAFAILESVISDLQAKAAKESLPEPEAYSPESINSRLAEFGPEQAALVQEFDWRTGFLGETAGRADLKLLEDRFKAFKPVDELDEKRAKLLKTELLLEYAKRDRLTGLMGRGMYFQNLEDSIGKDKPGTVIAMDMAFLKYFDKEGGGKTGDKAIITAARILEHAGRRLKDDLGITAQCYRVGGDEFSMTLDTDNPELARKAVDLIKQDAIKVGKIPMHDGATDNYEPLDLQFNFGLRSMPGRKKFRQELEAAGIKLESEPGSQEETRELANFQTKWADKAVESEKAVNRFRYLVSRRLFEVTNKPGTDEERLMRTKRDAVFVTYSEKAIFGHEGGAKINEWISRLETDEGELRQILGREIQEFVTDKLRQKGKDFVAFEDGALEGLIGDLRLTFAEMRIKELETDLKSTETRFGREHVKVSELTKKLEEARKAHEEIVNIRKRMGI